MNRRTCWLAIALWIAACSLTKPSRDEITGGNGKGGHAGTLSDGSAGSGAAGVGATGGTVGSGGSGGQAGTAALGGGSGVAGAGGSGTGASGGTAGSGGGQPEAGSVLFDDPFDVQKPEWKFGGDGLWSLANGLASQTDANATYPIRWVSTLAAATDYRLTARAKRANPSDGALQLIFRVNDANPNEFYYVSWHPGLHEISFGRYFGTNNSVGISDKTVPVPNLYDPDQWVTLHLEVQANKFHFWVDEVPLADDTEFDATYASGAPGLKTYLLQADYDSFLVEAL
jgi:hypothetical protein